MEDNRHLGSSFDEFLEEEGMLAEANAIAIKRLLAWQLRQEMPDAENCQMMLDRVEHTEAVQAVRESMAAFEQGEGRLAREAFEELRAEHDIPR